MASTYESIATTTLSSDTTITFTGISQSYTDLVLILQGNRITTSNTYIQMGNGSIDTGSNYSLTYFRGYGGGSIGYGTASNLSNGIFIDAGTDNSQISTQIIHFMNYANTNTNKTIVYRFNQTSTEVGGGVGMWRSTSAINQIKVWTAGNGTLSTGYTATLYGIKAA
jgi:hypothetical protein